jgi:phenylpropionate dioxygenase-like ring-hydroxylating dioxygenase large terminal subunit
MLKNHWYAVEFGKVVAADPVHVQLMGQQLVLWRDRSGRVRAQSDVCIHRGGSLAGGKVVDGCIECPYHGWQYDSDGRCTKIPANRSGVPIPKKARIDTYPCIERYGYVFVFLGDLPEDERPPFPVIDVLDPVPQIRAEGFRTVTGEFQWSANFERVLENGVDIAHAPFVHGNSFGNRDKPEVDDYDVDEVLVDGHAVGNISTVSLDPPAPSGVWKLIAKKSEDRPRIKTRTGIFFPNLTMLEVNLPLGVMRIFSATVPVDATTTISKWSMMRNFFTGRWADRDSVRRTHKIFVEDQPTVEGQRPDLVPMDLSAELHIKSDANQLAYRRWRQKAMDKGWGIPDFIPSEASRGSVTVVASPARREDPDLANAWVLKEMQDAEALAEARELHQKGSR